MKKRHSITINIKQCCRMIEEESIDFNYPIQRAGGQWNLHQKSLLVRSVLVDYEIPNVYSVSTVKQNNSNNASVYNEINYSIIDGKQRLTSLYDFSRNKFSLDENTPAVRLKDAIYEIAGLRFEQLAPELKEMFYDYSLGMTHFVNITDDELSDMFYCLNNGTAMSAQQKNKAFIGINAAKTLATLTGHDFMQNKLILTEAQRKKADDEQVLMQFMMLIDEDYSYKNLQAPDIAFFAKSLKEKTDSTVLAQTEWVLDYLDKVYDKGADFMLKKKNMPFIAYLANHAINKDVDVEVFKAWHEQFKSLPSGAFSAYMEQSKKPMSKKSINARIEILTKDFNRFAGIADEAIDESTQLKAI